MGQQATGLPEEGDVMWLMENMGTIVIGLLILGIVFLAAV